MSTKRKRWLYGIVGATASFFLFLIIAGYILSGRFEPLIREHARQYLNERCKCDVQLAALRIKIPKMSPLKVLFTQGRGVTARVEGEGVSMRYKGTDLPHLFAIRKFAFDVDLGTVFADAMSVNQVTLEGMEINVPPKGERKPLTDSSAPKSENGESAAKVTIQRVEIKDAKLTIIPKDRSKVPLDFDLQTVLLTADGDGIAMKYDASLTNPKPRGQIRAVGKFGPWDADEPSNTPLQGDYEFNNADLGVFKGIAGILNSTGKFEGVLSSITARGEASVPDFRLTMARNPVPLTTQFEVLVDGTNGNTILKPVQAKLGSTQFHTSGGIVKHEGEKRRSIELDVIMPNGHLRDVLRLAMKGDPFMEGRLYLKTKIAIPPLSGKVREKLRLDGQFKVTGGQFLRTKIQDEIDKMSRRAQGNPTSQEIDEVVSDMRGSFLMEDEKITFRTLGFQIPGAAVQLTGDYDLHADALNFLGTLRLQAKVSQTMTGWKRIALKPVDPFFAKNGAGTFINIAVTGSSSQPKFGLARGKKQAAEGGKD